MSRAMLDACDRYGVLVMDELTDMWTESKTDFDAALDFPEWWERDVEAMVRKDVNHPSVVLYSIGNEIPEVAKPHGAVWSRRLAEKVRSLDDTRFVTNGINAMLAVIGEAAAPEADAGRHQHDAHRHGRLHGGARRGPSSSRRGRRSPTTCSTRPA